MASTGRRTRALSPEAESARSLARRHGGGHQRDARQARRLPHAFLYAGRSGLSTSLPIFSRARSSIAGLERVFPNGDVPYPGIGMFTEADDHGPHLRHRGDRGRAGACRPAFSLGDEILVRRRPRRSVQSARSAARSDHPSRCRSAAPPAVRRRVAVSPADFTRTRCSCAGLKESARIITQPARVGYVHVWSYASRSYPGRARGPDRRGAAEGCRRPGLGPSRRMGRRATVIPRPVQRRARPRCRSRTATARPASSM